MRFKGYENKVLSGEDIAEIDYQPLKCSRPYRLIIVRKNISVQKRASGGVKIVKIGRFENRCRRE